MIVLTPAPRADWQRTHPRTLSDLARRSLVHLARAHGATLTDVTRVAATEAEQPAAALRAACAALPQRTVPEWFNVMDAALACGRAPRAADYWSTMEAQLTSITAWIAASGGFTIEARPPQHPAAQASA